MCGDNQQKKEEKYRTELARIFWSITLNSPLFVSLLYRACTKQFRFIRRIFVIFYSSQNYELTLLLFFIFIYFHYNFHFVRFIQVKVLEFSELEEHILLFLIFFVVLKGKEGRQAQLVLAKLTEKKFQNKKKYFFFTFSLFRKSD